MRRQLKQYLNRTTGVILQPVLENQAGVGKETQILLHLKYREMLYNGAPPPEWEEIGFNTFSSTDEDGMLLYIFSVIGTHGRQCVDIGAGGVAGSNTANLLVHHGFSGLLIDGNAADVQRLRDFYIRRPETKRNPPRCLVSLVSQENVNDILSANGMVGPIDLLSIDVDGMDYWIWQAIRCIEPQVVLIEYQNILGPERSWVVPYRPDFNARAYEVNRELPNYSGASLRALVKLAKEKGYRLVGCNRGGWNAFFVRAGVGEAYLPEMPVEQGFTQAGREVREQRFLRVKDMDWQEV